MLKRHKRDYNLANSADSESNTSAKVNTTMNEVLARNVDGDDQYNQIMSCRCVCKCDL